MSTDTRRFNRPISPDHGLNADQLAAFTAWVASHPFLPEGFDVREAIVECMDNCFDVHRSEAWSCAMGTFASQIEDYSPPPPPVAEIRVTIEALDVEGEVIRSEVLLSDVTDGDTDPGFDGDIDQAILDNIISEV
jgi:hypothetical protein